MILENSLDLTPDHVPDEICLCEAIDPVEGNWEEVERESRRRLRITERHQSQIEPRLVRGMIQCLKEDFPEDADLFDHMTVSELTAAFIAEPSK